MADINTIGSGVEFKEDENSYILRVMKNNDFGKSKSGKSTLKATTHGEVALPNGDFLNLNYYTKVNAKKTKKPIKKMSDW